MARPTRLVILIKNICTLWGRKRFFLPVTYFPTNLVYPFTLRVTGLKICSALFFRSSLWELKEIYVRSSSFWLVHSCLWQNTFGEVSSRLFWNWEASSCRNGQKDERSDEHGKVDSSSDAHQVNGRVFCIALPIFFQFDKACYEQRWGGDIPSL